LYVKSIADIKAEGMKGWMYAVNGEMPSVGAAEYMLSDDDCVEFFYGSWGVSAENADYRIIIHVNLTNITVIAEKVLINSFEVSNAVRGGNATAWINLTAMDEGWYVIVVSGTNNGEGIAGISTAHLNANESLRVPVLISIPQQVSTGEYRLYTGVYELDDYPANILNWYGYRICEVS
jgi:hypothetical protein